MASNTPPPLRWITKGSVIQHEGRSYVIDAIVDLDKVLAKDTATKEKVLLSLGTVEPTKPIEPEQPDATVPAGWNIYEVPQELWDIALERKRLIEPLLEGHYSHRNGLAKQIAQQAGVSHTIIYEWVQQYRQTATLDALLPNAYSDDRDRRFR